MTDTGVDFLLQSLNELINRDKYNPFIIERDQIRSLYDGLASLRTFLVDSEEKRYEHEEVKDLVARIGDVASDAENIIDKFIVHSLDDDGNMVEKSYWLFGHGSLVLSDMMEEIKSIKTQVTEIYDKKIMYCIGKSSYGSSSKTRKTTTPQQLLEEAAAIVGFDDEAMTILERLTGEQKQLDLVSIVGMPGLGKTTLARKVYNDPYVLYHFHIRAWIHVSRAYQKRDLLLGILSSVVGVLADDRIHNMTDERLCEELYRRLIGKRYLVVIDDIWDLEVWDDLKDSFPDDSKGSRILLTSRLTEVAMHAKLDSPPHSLRFLTKKESWDLFLRKVFRNESSCPSELIEIGKQIAEKCQGLPLAIVVIAGLLARNKTQDWWKQVVQSVGSHIATDPEQYMETLALSYNHLPHHLKACFLYFGAFPEDYVIPMQKLIRLWVAEGFIRKQGQRSLEEEAEDCLMDLIDRSLIIVAQKRLIGGVKTCRIHDLLHDLCLKISVEEKFLQQIYKSGQLFSSSDSSSSSTSNAYKQRRLCIHSHFLDYMSSRPSAPHVRSLLCSAFEWSPLPRPLTSFIYEAFTLLRVLDLESISITFFPSEIARLVHLRYLALRTIIEGLGFPQSIINLRNLETLIVLVISGSANLPHNIGKMVKLRHLRVMGSVHIPHGSEPSNNGYYPFELFNLQTISTLSLSCWNEEVLSRIPNIRKLGCVLGSSDGFLPKLDCLIYLETLKATYRSFTEFRPARFPSMNMFPLTLKKLTSSRFRLPWSEISIFGRLPNLEVLKLLDEAFEGPLWDTSEEEFLQLKFLKLQDLDIEQWNIASIDHFPSLERLVLVRCGKLEEIPFGLGDIPTLEMIEVNSLSRSAANSARQIQEEQENMGNDVLKILIYPRIDEDQEAADDDAHGM